MTVESIVDTVAALEAIIGATPPAMHLKVIDHLDAGALRWLSRSPVMFAGFGNGEGMRITVGGGKVGFAGGSRCELRLPLAMLDDAAIASPSSAMGALFLLPGIGETLRVNGKVAAIDKETAIVEVGECYGHCAKAMIRSQFWSAKTADVSNVAEPFIDDCRFIAFTTMNAHDCADVSPKGDPAGGMARLDGDTLWFADRPGNRRVDSFRNIIEQPHVALALLVPGSAKIARVHGRACLSTDLSMRVGFTVQGKVPSLVIGVDIDQLELCQSPALLRANLWPVIPEETIKPTDLFIEHIKLNKTKGMGAALARASVGVPGMRRLMQKGLDQDYKNNLY